MKKLSMLIAMILCVTIGGVYATWTYAGNDVTDKEYEKVIALSGVATSDPSGAYEITSNISGIVLDQKATGDYTAVLSFGSNNSEAPFLTVTFTPSETLASDEIKANGLPTEIEWKISKMPQVKLSEGTGEHAGKWYVDNESGTLTDLFIIEDEADGVFTENVTWTKQLDGTFTYTLDNATLLTKVKLNKNLYLDERADYDVVHAALVGVTFTIVVTDGQTPSSNA
ncbi:MAG: hypothetical protein IKA12_01545 [Clostridia bacterium]|nr:hypothetical protein [Clostridia bacterium]